MTTETVSPSPKQGLYLQNCNVYIDDLATPRNMVEYAVAADEALDVITGLWNGTSFSYDGEFYTLDAAELPYSPVQEPRIPILLGCWWPNTKPFKRAVNWDGIMPSAPSFYGSEGEQGEPVYGSIEEEVGALVEYYQSLSDDPGEILLPIDVPEAPADLADTCRDLGATWLLTTELLESDSHKKNLERIREDPPS